VYVLEANLNPQLAYGEDFAESAERPASTTPSCCNASSTSACAAPDRLRSA
jgi:hypothetical protein